MRIAIPVVKGQLCLHFGHCEHFAIFDTNIDSGEITSACVVLPPPHMPGLLPRWLVDQRVHIVIASGMGEKAQAFFYQNNVEVLLGAPESRPESLVKEFLAGSLKPGENACEQSSKLNSHC